MKNQARQQRRGATVLEMSVILTVFLVLTFGMLDLGIGVFRYHILAQAARHGARRAIVHGEMANQLGSWGPTPITAAANSGGTPIVDGAVDGLKSMLVGCDLAQTTISVQWLDGDNEFGSRVKVDVQSPYTPLFLFIFTGPTITLSASSTMAIAH